VLARMCVGGNIAVIAVDCDCPIIGALVDCMGPTAFLEGTIPTRWGFCYLPLKLNHLCSPAKVTMLK
jgi:hypothetical protein